MSLPGEIVQGILARSALVILRVYLGLAFLLSAVPKLQRDPAPEFIGFLEQVALQRGHPFYQEFVRGVVLPNAPTFAAVISWGEFLVGTTLLLGIFTRFSAGMALLLSLSYLFARGGWFWSPGSADAAHLAISLALMIGAAGRTLGLDALLAKRWPRSPLW